MVVPVVLWVIFTIVGIILEYTANSIYWMLDHIEYYFEHINTKIHKHDTEQNGANTKGSL